MSATLASAASKLPAAWRERAAELGLLPEDTPEGAVQKLEEQLGSGRLQEPKAEASEPEEKAPEAEGAFYKGEDGRRYVRGGGYFLVSRTRDNKEGADPQAGIKSMRPYISAGLYVTVFDSEGHPLKRYAPSK